MRPSTSGPASTWLITKFLTSSGPPGWLSSGPRVTSPVLPPLPRQSLSKSPHAELLTCDIHKHYLGQCYARLGHSGGWQGIVREFDLNETCMANTGFERCMRAFSSTIPAAWESARFLWWGPASLTPEGFYWCPVDASHPALQMRQFYPSGGYGRPPSFLQSLSKWLE